MDWSDGFALAGALAMFVFGMYLSARATEKRAGPWLQRTLAHLTDDPLRGFALGLAVTAAVQSSGSASVMVVGFVNSGLLSLHGAVGVILGSNVGTTLTPWVLCLAGGLGGAGHRLAGAQGLGASLAFVGMVLYLFFRAERRRTAGAVLLGLGLAFMGLGGVCRALEPVAALPWFSAVMGVLSHPLAGVLAGALAAAVLQSSAVAVGLLQALAFTGALPWAAAVPLLMGMNIGSCVPALLAGVGANAQARRTAAVHLYFNVLAAALFLALMGVLQAAGLWEAAQPASMAGLAMVHTACHVLAAAVLLPAVGALERLAVATVPAGDGPQSFQLLDSRLLGQPALAVRRAGDVAGQMAARARKSLVQAMSLTGRWDEELAREIDQAEERIDSAEDALGTYLLRLGRQSLTIDESRTLSALAHTVNDFERIGDHAVSLASSARAMHSQNLAFSPQARQELAVMERAVQDILTSTIAAYALITGTARTPAAQSAAKQAAAGVEPLAQVVEELARQLKDRHIHRLQAGQCSPQLGFTLADVVNDYARVADHCSNVAATALSADTDSFDTHDSLERMRTSGQDYPARVAACRRQYALDSTGGIG